MLREFLGNARFMRPWVPGHSHFLWSQFSDIERNRRQGFSDLDHLKAAAEWLERAQDATPDGGVVGRYRLNVGWTSSYPETTGYIIPTFLDLADHLGESRYRDRARRAVEFLLGLQLENGAFPGGEVHENTEQPSPFNTGQILNGLVAWHAASGDDDVLTAARRAGDWLVSVQDEDGAFRKHFYYDQPACYSAHLTCWLAQLGDHTGDEKYLQAVGRHLDWVMQHCDRDSGWVDRMGFDKAQHESGEAFTHTIAYTIWGMLYSAEILQRQDVLDAVDKAAAGIGRRLELSRRLPGRLGPDWRSAARFCCLTGNAQMALIWMRLFERTQDVWWLNPAFKAIDEIKLRQPMQSDNPGIRGGVPGSFPIWGDYIFGGIPNWAAKFYLDALLQKSRVLEGLSGRERPPGSAAMEATQLPAVTEGAGPARIVVLTRSHSRRLSHFAAAWEKYGVKPEAVVFEGPRPASRRSDLENHIRSHGLGATVRRIVGVGKAPQTPQTANPGPAQPATSQAFCAEHKIAPVQVPPLTTQQAIETVGALRPDVLIQAGVGILRKGLLETARLGTVNVHMSLLPGYRGMNVAEWAALNGHQQGCTVHLIDTGIDTGDVLLRRPVDTAHCRSVAELRAAIDTAQAEALAEVLDYVARSGTLPPRQPQAAEDGRQYFTMHEDLRRVLEAELAGRQQYAAAD